MYQNFIFDFYGTLADIRTDEDRLPLWEKMSEIFRAMGADYTPSELKAAFRKLGQTADALAEPDLHQGFKELYLQRGIPCDDAQARLTGIVFRALSREFIHAYDGAEELLAELKRRGKGVYLLSNAQTDFTRPEIGMLGLTDYFDGIFISSEQGCRKPAARFLQRLLEKYGLQPSECVLIGNDETSDIAVAHQAGIDSVYFHSAISPREYGRLPATYRVLDGDFRKLAKLLLELG